MKRHQDIGLAFAQLLLLLTLTATSADKSSAMDALSTEVQRGIEVKEISPQRDRCEIRHFDSPGIVWIEIRSTYPDTSPALLIMDADGPHDPRMIERRQAFAYRIARAGEHIICRTTQAPLDDRVVILVHKSDELEIEVDEDPMTAGDKSDELEIEVDEDP